MSDLTKYEMLAQTDGSVLARSSDDEHVDYDADSSVKWYSAADVDDYIESLNADISTKEDLIKSLVSEINDLEVSKVMKYRIRDIETGKITKNKKLILIRDGRVACIDDYGDVWISRWYKAEMEVADGFYEGDYLLSYLGDEPMVYHVESHYRINIVGTNTKYSGSIKAFLRCADFEVIKCR